MKVRAGALFVAVTISFVIAVLISLLIILAYYFKIQNKENLLQKKLERNADSALNILMVNDAITDEILTIDLYGEESDSVQITKKIWGIYETASVKAYSGKYSLTKTAQYGYASTDELSPAIYLTDLNKPLNICGKTTIEGTCYLPEAGLKIEYIEGTGFSGTKPGKECIKKSSGSLPVLDKKVLRKLTTSLEGGSFSYGLYKEVNLSDADSLNNSFLDTTALIKIDGQNLGRVFLEGNIILYSNNIISLDADAILEDVLIFAPCVIIKKGFAGNIQVFATDSIVVEEDCKLNYPSSLGVFKKGYKTSQPFIKIKKGAELTGTVFTNVSESFTDQKETMITIEKGARVKGQVYVEGFAEIKGEVIGSVWCNRFYHQTPKGGKYENHMLDALIDRTNLSKYYVGSVLIPSGTKKKIVKWLE